MLHSLFQLFRAQPPTTHSLGSNATNTIEHVPLTLTPDTRVVLDTDHHDADFVAIDLKTLSYAEIAALSLQHNDNAASNAIGPVTVPVVPQLEHRTPNNNNNQQQQQRVGVVAPPPFTADSIVQDIHFNDKNNRGKKKKFHVKKGKYQTCVKV